MIRGIHHIAINTANFDRMLQFYTEGFGFTPSFPAYKWTNDATTDRIIGVKGSGARAVMLKAGTCFIELFEYLTPEDRREGPPLRPHDRGYTHFCVDVTDMAEEFARLSKLGMTFAYHEPVESHGNKVIYGRDPDGNIIELQETAPDVPFALKELSGREPQKTR